MSIDEMRCHRVLPIMPGIVLGMLLYLAPLCFAQERPTILAGHGTLSGSILPLWVGAEAKLFEKYGLQVKPIYLPRAAGRPALLSGDIQVYFSAGPPLVQMRLGGADVVVTSCVVHKLTSKIMVTAAIQKVADLRGKVLAVANPGSASDFAAKTFSCAPRDEGRSGYFHHLQRFDKRGICGARQRQGAGHLRDLAERHAGCSGGF